MKTKLFKLTQAFTVICLMAFLPVSYAQNGLDPAFGNNGTVTLSFGDTQSSAESVLQLSNGKILTVGWVYNNTTQEEYVGAARFLTDGTLDTAFGTNGIQQFMVMGGNASGYDTAEDSNGNIYISGYVEVTTSNDYSAFLSKLTPNGAIDTSFGTNGSVVTTYGTGLESDAYNVAVQPDNKIVITGDVIYSDPTYELSDFALARYNPDGTLDTTFGSGGYVTTTFNPNHYSYISEVIIMPNGKILVSGTSGIEDPVTFEDTADVVLARYNADGSLDNTFGNGGKKIIDIYDYDFNEGMTLQADGKIVLAGNTESTALGIDDAMVIRLNADGSLDTSFNGTGFATTSFGADGYSTYHSPFINGDGSILAVGRYEPYTSATVKATIFAKYTQNGVLDTSFDGDGKYEFEDDDVYTSQAIVTNEQKLLTCGEKWDNNNIYDFYLAQFILENAVGIDEMTANKIAVYPNPATDYINIDFEIAVTGTQIQLYDVLGKEVLNVQTDTKKETLNIGNLKAGVYFLQINQNGQILNQKIVVQ